MPLVYWRLSGGVPTLPAAVPNAHSPPPAPLSSAQDGEYSGPDLRAAFAAHGSVEDVVVREGKKKKGSALVVMATPEAAAAAACAACGSLANPLLVVPFAKVGRVGWDGVDLSGVEWRRGDALWCLESEWEEAAASGTLG